MSSDLLYFFIEEKLKSSHGKTNRTEKEQSGAAEIGYERTEEDKSEIPAGKYVTHEKNTPSKDGTRSGFHRC